MESEGFFVFCLVSIFKVIGISSLFLYVVLIFVLFFECSIG